MSNQGGFMSFFKKFLFFSLFVSFISFVSCSPNDRGHKKSKHQRNKVFVDGSLLFEMFFITIDKFETATEILKEEKEIYRDMVRLAYKVNKIHNQVVERQKLSLETLDSLSRHIKELEEQILDLEGPISEEIFESLSVIESNLKFMEDLVNGVKTGEEDEPVAEESVELIEDSAEASVDEESVGAVEEPAIEESVELIEDSAEVSVDEESVGAVEEPAIEESVELIEDSAEASVDEESVGAVEEPAIEESVELIEDSAEASVDEESVGAVEEPAIEESVELIEDSAEVSVDEESVGAVEEPAIEESVELIEDSNSIFNIHISPRRR